MGNQNGREHHVPSGSPLDFFQTPPTTPTQAELTAMALSSAASPEKAQTPSPAGSVTPSTEWAQKPAAAAAAPSEWAVIGADGAAPSEASDAERLEQRVAVGLGAPPAPPASGGSASERSWQERDSGLEPQPAADRAGEEMTLVLLSLMEHYRDPLGLTPNTDVTTGAVELLRRLITEREELVEEVDTLRETLRTERLEWQQFQSDLQVAVSVADRLRVESEQALGSLQERHRAAEEQLARALGRQQEAEQELRSLKAEHRDVRHRLTELQQERGDAAGDASEGRDDGEEGREEEEEEKPTEDADDEEVGSSQETDVTAAPEDESGEPQLKGKGVAESYLRRLAALEKKKEDGRGPRDPRKVLMLAERSWSLSRLPLPSEPAGQKDASKNTSTTLPLCRKEEPTKGRRPDRALKRQDSWSNFYTGKQDEDQSSDSIRPQDGFSALLRRHGGSRRNSLLRWCQSRTQGYKNIEITNFSSSWEDGLAFCAVYHTYLPTRVPFDSLNPADKKENLDFAFKTGETLGITATLTVEEMLKADGPDWQRVLGYVESIFRHFEM